MAITVSESSTYTHVTGNMSGLTYNAENYDDFKWHLYKWNGSSWAEVATYQDYPFDHYGQKAFSHTFTYQQPGYSYYVTFDAKYGGTWYYGYASGTYTTAPALPEATFSNESTQKTNIIFDYTNSVGNLTLQIYNGSTWVAIASSGIPYSKTGNTITISSLYPNYSYFFRVETALEGYTSYSPFTAPYYKTYTTQAWPTIPSGVVLGSSGRYEGGNYLTWGDHGYESYGFQYFLRLNNAVYYRYTGHANNTMTTGDYGVQTNYAVSPVYNGYGENGTQAWGSSGTYTTNAGIYTVPKGPGGVTIGTKTTTSIQVTATGMTQTYSSIQWMWRVYNSGSGFSNYQDYGGSLTYTIPNLSPNTTYEVQCYAYVSGAGLYSLSYYTTYPYTNDLPTLSTPSINVTAYSYNYMNYTLGSVSGAQNYYTELWYGGSYLTYASGQSFGFTNLTNGLTYTLKPYCTGSGYHDSAKGSLDQTTLTLPTPSAPTNVSFSRDSSVQTTVNGSWTKGANTTSMDIDISIDGADWGIIDWPTQVLDSYGIPTGTIDARYFRIRPHNYFDAYNEKIGSWTSGILVPAGVLGNTYYWNGSAWALGEVYYWNGSAWVQTAEPVKTWNGSSWV